MVRLSPDGAQRHAIADLPEARAFLAYPLLGPRLAECTDVMLGWAARRSAEDILGSIDAIKFRSSMTLFEAAAAARAMHRLSHPSATMSATR